MLPRRCRQSYLAPCWHLAPSPPEKFCLQLITQPRVAGSLPPFGIHRPCPTQLERPRSRHGDLVRICAAPFCSLCTPFSAHSPSPSCCSTHSLLPSLLSWLRIFCVSPPPCRGTAETSIAWLRLAIVSLFAA